MKKISVLAIALLSGISVFAQKYVPKIDAGTQMGYTISMNGEKINFLLNVNSIADSVKMTWEVSKYGTGTYVMAAKSLEDGKKMFMQAPQPDEVTKLSDAETMAFISKTAFKSMAKSQTMEFDDLTYTVTKAETSPIKIDNKELDVVHAISADGKNEMWILNNPDFPLICKTKNGTLGADLTLNYIR
ncbi:hypothetical protein [Mucilaginibacter paludis]|uniref:DUF4412 domain-containing protein n=1 Tax=Mucilaginibacter paludis DSM 18603 TaxID=714943 RepID=H1YC14_9SPHI|nr:hypothetical protein [Mucilaginibacter paludis]EHQ29577.1 hypothetical protein Mucpa_5505 [Mucilaginibacter paludis DSM 18603]